MPFLSQVAVRRVGPGRWQLTEDLCYRDDDGPVPGRVFTTPAGYTTDWATIPRIAAVLVPKLGPWDEPAVTHDLGCDALRERWQQRRAGHLEPREVWLDARGVDQLWHRALRDVGVGPLMALLLWVAVRWGALTSSWRRDGWWRDALLVLAVTAAVILSARYAVLWADALAHFVAALLNI